MEALRKTGKDSGALRGLRATCRQLRALANAHTRHVSSSVHSDGSAFTAGAWRCKFKRPAVLFVRPAGRCCEFRHHCSAPAVLPQVRFVLGDPAKAPLGHISRCFPSATVVEIGRDSGVSWHEGIARLAACLEALPDACWPAAEVFGSKSGGLRAPLAVHASRLCPQLRKASVSCETRKEGAALVAALEGIAAAAGSLRILNLR